MGNLNEKFFGMQKLIGLQGSTAKTVKNGVFFGKNLTMEGGDYNDLQKSRFRLSVQYGTFEF